MKQRADTLLVEKGLCESRSLAQRLILAGQVRSGPDRVVAKASELFPTDAEFQIDTPCPYVSRGAYKLKVAIDTYQPLLQDRVALDLGASTGGFTDLLLQCGVRKVYAVDCGRGQLHQRLRQDPRVICREGVNARFLDATVVPEPMDILTADLSFISLRLVLPAAAPFLKPDGWAMVLIKPQFEAGRAEVGKGGVVRDPVIHGRCIQEITTFAEQTLHWLTVGVVASPITGPAGNHEFIGVFRGSREGASS